jgi:hypothetical protein
MRGGVTEQIVAGGAKLVKRRRFENPVAAG